MKQMDGTARIIDANYNRAREALRVMEEHARFALEDAELSEWIKQARHELSHALAAWPKEPLLASRDVPGDVGREIPAPPDTARRTTTDVATAAARRASEALRCLEEYGKLIDAPLAGRLEKLRFRVYEIEQRLLATAPRLTRLRQARLHVLITASHCRGDWRDAAEAALRGGADVLQLREKDIADAELLARARMLCDIGHARGALVIVNDRPDIARLSGADGVHLGQSDLPTDEARCILGPTGLVGRSSHVLTQARAALEERPDYLAVGPMFASRTKPRADIPGPALAAAVIPLAEIPVVAIGGITPARMAALTEAGVRCVAVCQSVIAADDPEAACRALLEQMQ
jgi:thiamine-phosphate pyrophosphorylase